MIKCKYCGGENPDNNKFCMNCGAPLEHDAQDAAEQQGFHEENLPPVQTGTSAPEQIPPEPHDNAQPFYETAPGVSGPAVEPVPIGGLIAWAIFNTLGCLIPGAVALYYIFKINKAASYDEQQQLLTNTKRILVVGTVLCVLNLIMQFGGRMS